MLPMKFDLAANEIQRHERVGRTVFVKSVTGEIEVTGWSSGGIIVGRGRLVQGNKITMAADFTVLEIKDTSGSANSVELLAGLGDFSEAGLGTIDSITKRVDTSPVVDASGFTIDDFAPGAFSSHDFFTAAANANGAIIYGVTANKDVGGATGNHMIVLVKPGAGFPVFTLARAQGNPDESKWDRPILIPAGYGLSATGDADGNAFAMFELL